MINYLVIHFFVSEQLEWQYIAWHLWGISHSRFLDVQSCLLNDCELIFFMLFSRITISPFKRILVKWNDWCFRPRLCTVSLNWAGDNLGEWDEGTKYINLCGAEGYWIFIFFAFWLLHCAFFLGKWIFASFSNICTRWSVGSVHTPKNLTVLVLLSHSLISSLPW